MSEPHKKPFCDSESIKNYLPTPVFAMISPIKLITGATREVRIWDIVTF